MRKKLKRKVEQNEKKKDIFGSDVVSDLYASGNSSCISRNRKVKSACCWPYKMKLSGNSLLIYYSGEKSPNVVLNAKTGKIVHYIKKIVKEKENGIN